MKTKTFAAIAAAALINFGASAEESIPAWQASAFVMEEVVAIASRVDTSSTRAWQQTGYVMEEIVVSAPQIDRENLHAAIREQLLVIPIALATRPLVQFSRG